MHSGWVSNEELEKQKSQDPSILAWSSVIQNVTETAEEKPKGEQKQPNGSNVSDVQHGLEEHTVKRSIKPALLLTERDEIEQMSDAFDFFLSKLDTNRVRRMHLKNLTTMEKMIEVVREEQVIYDLFFDEVVREVRTQCRPRGDLLAKLRTHYAQLFIRMPELCIEMARELEFVQGLVSKFQRDQASFRDNLFELQIELQEYKTRYRDAAMQVESLESQLISVTHESSREKAIYERFKLEWLEQRKEMEDEIAALKLEREERAAVVVNDVMKVDELGIPNPLVYALLGDEDEKDEVVEDPETDATFVTTAVAVDPSTSTSKDDSSPVPSQLALEDQRLPAHVQLDFTSVAEVPIQSSVPSMTALKTTKKAGATRNKVQKGIKDSAKHEATPLITLSRSHTVEEVEELVEDSVAQSLDHERHRQFEEAQIQEEERLAEFARTKYEERAAQLRKRGEAQAIFAKEQAENRKAAQAAAKRAAQNEADLQRILAEEAELEAKFALEEEEKRIIAETLDAANAPAPEKVDIAAQLLSSYEDKLQQAHQDLLEAEAKEEEKKQAEAAAAVAAEAERKKANAAMQKQDVSSGAVETNAQPADASSLELSSSPAPEDADAASPGDETAPSALSYLLSVSSTHDNMALSPAVTVSTNSSLHRARVSTTIPDFAKTGADVIAEPRDSKLLGEWERTPPAATPRDVSETSSDMRNSAETKNVDVDAGASMRSQHAAQQMKDHQVKKLRSEAQKSQSTEVLQVTSEEDLVRIESSDNENDMTLDMTEEHARDDTLGESLEALREVDSNSIVLTDGSSEAHVKATPRLVRKSIIVNGRLQNRVELVYDDGKDEEVDEEGEDAFDASDGHSTYNLAMEAKMQRELQKRRDEEAKVAADRRKRAVKRAEKRARRAARDAKKQHEAQYSGDMFNFVAPPKPGEELDAFDDDDISSTSDTDEKSAKVLALSTQLAELQQLNERLQQQVAAMNGGALPDEFTAASTKQQDPMKPAKPSLQVNTQSDSPHGRRGFLFSPLVDNLSTPLEEDMDASPGSSFQNALKRDAELHDHAGQALLHKHHHRNALPAPDDRDSGKDERSATSKVKKGAITGALRSLLFNARILDLLGVLTKEAQFHKLLDQKATVRLDALAWIGRWVREMYLSKATADEVARVEGTAPVPFPEFMYERVRQKYGLKEVIDQKAMEVLVVLSKFRSQFREIEICAQFLEESRSVDEFVLFLRARSVVASLTVGIRYSSNLTSKNTVDVEEYICLYRAQDALNAIFGSQHESVVAELMEKLEGQSTPWSSLKQPPDERTLKRLAHMQSYSPLCVPISAFLDMVVLRFRQFEAQQRDNEIAKTLFESVPLKPDGCMDFVGFQTIFEMAEPRYAKREIGQLFANLVRSIGSDHVTLSDFQRLVHQLIQTGVVFTVSDPKLTVEQSEAISSITRAWASFRGFFQEFSEFLERGDQKRDFECAQTLKTLRFLMDNELTKPHKWEIRHLRLVSLYRGILHVILSHQAAWLLAEKVTPKQVIDVELAVLHRIILQRHKLLLLGTVNKDTWLSGMVDPKLSDSTAPMNPPAVVNKTGRPVAALAKKEPPARAPSVVKEPYSRGNRVQNKVWKTRGRPKIV